MAVTVCCAVLRYAVLCCAVIWSVLCEVQRQPHPNPEPHTQAGSPWPPPFNNTHYFAPSFSLNAQAGLGLKGLWVGLLLGDFSAMVMSLIAVARTRWKEEAASAHAAVMEAGARVWRAGEL